MAILRGLGIMLVGLVGCGRGPPNQPIDVHHRKTLAEEDHADKQNLATPSVPVSVTDLHGRPVDPFADSNLKSVVLIFVCTSCPIANQYAPTIQKLYERYRSKPVGFWLVFADGSESGEEIEEHLSAYKHQAPALRDTQHHLVAFCQATKTPEAVVFAPQRKLAYRGRIDDLFTDFGKRRDAPTSHDLRDAVDALLEGRAVDLAEIPAVGCDIPGAKP
jgi:hypothetical protein